jgi:DHA2 family multidrug resistance protein
LLESRIRRIDDVAGRRAAKGFEFVFDLSTDQAAEKMSSPSAVQSQMTEEWKPSHNPWLVAGTVLCATFMVVLDTSVANIALPHIAGNLSASTDESTWVLTCYLIANAIMLPAAGWIANVFGRKRFMIASLVVFTLASLLCGAATSLGMLIAARVLQGLGGGGMQPVAQAVLLESFPRQKRGMAMAVYGLGVVVAPIIGPTLGGWLTDTYTWRWVFYINLPVGVLAVMMSRAFLEDPPYIRGGAPREIDYFGFAIMALWLGTFQVMLDQGQQEDWFASAWITWFCVIAVVSFAVFVLWEIRQKHPIVDLRIFKDRNFSVGTVLIGLMGAVLYGSLALLPIFLQTLMGYPALQSGFAITPRGVGVFLSTILVGRLIGIIDDRWLAAVGFGVLGYATLLFSRINLEIAMSSVMWPNVISGLAMGFLFVPLTTATVGMLRQEQMGNATGIFNLMRNLGGGVGIALTTTMLARGAQTHQALMASHLNPYNPLFQQRVHQIQGFLTAQNGVGTPQRTYAFIYGIVSRQARLMAFVDNFRYLAIVCFICVPLVFFFRKVRIRRAPVAGE